MKLVIWGIAGIALVFGTLFAALTAAAAEWLVATSPQWAHQAGEAAEAAAQVPLPAWLTAWVDPALLAPLQDMMRASASMMASAAPWLQPLLGWVAPLVWLLWALIAVAILIVAGVLHALAGRATRRAASSGHP